MYKENERYIEEKTSIPITTFFKKIFIIFNASTRAQLHPALAAYLDTVEAKNPPDSIGILYVDKDHFRHQELKAECKSHYLMLSNRVNRDTKITLSGHSHASIEVLCSDGETPVGYPALAVASILREIKSDGIIMERSMYSFSPADIYSRPLLRISVHACQAENFATALFTELYNSKTSPIFNAMITSTMSDVIGITSRTGNHVTPTDPKDSLINIYFMSVINLRFTPRNHKLKYEFSNKKRVIYFSSRKMTGFILLLMGTGVLAVALGNKLGSPLAFFSLLLGMLSCTLAMTTATLSQCSNAKHKVVLLPSTRQSNGEITLFKIPKIQYKLNKLNQPFADTTSHTKSI